MDLNVILHAISDFLSTDAGAAIARVLGGIFQFLYPANAPGAWDVPLPDTSPRP
ncbi:hypothetical protein [Corynebacterium suicordis]|uniref:Uncharacterized protein n=1 Tax=Corynebacterium suicordis DSM 45110 TaxID=1121369 RepID=A0ABR9ZLP4_9CORY|nr:hypothetical protein [Corynebacterium suicordis]MBF4554356.1 hypothetical protein [Corynebacterium suicordis DSM 45110]MDR6276664.1 hypothetical protein [Corynebacterium suicordis]